MRTLLGVLCVACLLASGCHSPRRGGTAASPASTGDSRPFLGLPPKDSPSSPETNNLTSAGGGGASRGSAVLAGRILDRDNQLRPDAIIQVIDLDGPRDTAAPLSVKANRDGYFDIAGLEAGHTYRLVARIKDGANVLIGSRRVVPPDVRVAIWVTEHGVEGEAAAADRVAGGPAASLGTPIRTGDGVTTPLPGSPPDARTGGSAGLPPAVSTQSDPSLIAENTGKTVQDGFTRDVPSPRVSVPSEPGREHKPEKPAMGPYSPPPPPMANDNAPGTPLVPSSAPSASPIPAPPSADGLPPPPGTDPAVSRTVVPSCVRVGGRVENFALYDVDGNVFELAKQRKGKLVLLDFWYVNCPPCRHAIPKLNAWKNKYDRHGLEVIGVTCEKGSLAQKQQTLAQGKRQYRLSFDYPLLFAGGGSGKCPVLEQLEVHAFPTLILLDETGRILHRAEGLDPDSAYRLETVIYRHLFGQRLASGQ